MASIAAVRCGWLALVIPSLAAAAPGDVVVGPPTHEGFRLARQAIAPVAPAPAGFTARTHRRVIYLNKDGVTVTPGDNDARVDRSSIAKQPATIPAWDVSAETWDATVACMRELFAPFDVDLVDTDPGDVPHIEAVFGGTPALLGLGRHTAGVSPFTTDCGVIESSMVFTFAGVLPRNPRLVCEIMAQEVAHSFGLDHELLAPDPMSYLNYDRPRAFQDEAAPCGESQPRPCGIDGATCRTEQNSFALLTERLGRRHGSAEALDGELDGGCSTGGADTTTLLLGVALALCLGRRATGSVREKRDRPGILGG